MSINIHICCMVSAFIFVKVCISAAVILAMSRPYVPLWRNAQIVFPTGDGFDAECEAYSFATGEIRFEFRKIADALLHDRKKSL